MNKGQIITTVILNSNSFTLPNNVNTINISVAGLGIVAGVLGALLAPVTLVEWDTGDTGVPSADLQAVAQLSRELGIETQHLPGTLAAEPDWKATHVVVAASRFGPCWFCCSCCGA